MEDGAIPKACPVTWGRPEGELQPIAFPESAPGRSLSPMHTALSGQWVCSMERKLGFENLIFWFQCYAIAELICELIWLARTPPMGLDIPWLGVPCAIPLYPELDTCQCTLSRSEFTLGYSHCLPCHQNQIHPHRKQRTRRAFGSSEPHLNEALILICRRFADFNYHWSFIGHNYYLFVLFFTGVMNSCW